MLAFCHLPLFLEVLIIPREMESVTVQRSQGASGPRVPGRGWGAGGQPRSQEADTGRAPQTDPAWPRPGGLFWKAQ